MHLDRIGDPAARFLDERLDFTDEFDTPLDTIIWLRNGGGKSTVLSLLCAHLRPKRTDFLAASSTNKHIEDYVQTGDTSHTVLEWVNEFGQRLITGAVYEWDGMQAPEDPVKNHDRLASTWYCLTPPEGMRSEDLPRLGAGGTPLRLKEFKAALRALPASHELAVCEDQASWARTLDNHGMDPDLLTPILTMNAVEGGIDSAFSYSNPAAFIRYLLALVADPNSAEQVARTLEKVRVQLANRPRTLVDLMFATEAEPRLSALATSYESRQVAARELALARADAVALACSFVARITATEALAEEHSAKVAEVAARHRAARSARDTATFTAAELRRIAAVLRSDAAKKWHADSTETVTAARERVAALGGLDRLAAQQRKERAVHELDLQMQQQEQGAAPLADRRDQAAGVLYRALTQELSALSEREVLRAAQTLAAEGKRADGRGTAGKARSQLSVLGAVAKQARKTISTWDAALAKARADGLLTAEQEPTAGRDHLAKTDADDGVHTAAIDVRRAELGAELVGFSNELVPARTAAGQAAAGLTAVRLEQRTLQAAVAQLAGDPAVQALAQDDKVDVLAEASELSGVAAEQVLRLDGDRMLHAVQTAEARRALAELELSQLLPPDVDLERALGALALTDIAATSGWRYLADNVPLERHAQVLGLAPALVAGVAVHDPGQLEAARQVLASALLRPITAIGVGTTADLHAAAAATGGGTWVVPPARALTDRGQAEQETGLRALEVSEADQRESDLFAERQSAAAIAAALSDLAGRYSPQDARRLEEQLTGAKNLDSHTAGELERLEQRERELKAEDGTLELEGRLIARRRLASTGRLARLEGLVEQATPAQAAHTELAGLPALESAQQELLSAGERAEHDADVALRRLEAQQSRDETAAQALTRDLDQLPVEATTRHAPAAAGDVPLAAARSGYEATGLAYEQATSGSQLAATLHAARDVLADYALAVSALPTTVRVAAQALLEAGVDPRQLPALTKEAAGREEDAGADLVEAGTELSLAGRELKSATPADRARHRMLEGPEPATRAQALADAAEQDSAREAALVEENAASEQATLLAAEATAHEQLTSDLTNLLAALPAPEQAPVGGLAFAGGVLQARELAVAAKDGLSAATGKDSGANADLDSESKAIFVWANDTRFASVTEQIRSRFRDPDPAAHLAPEAAGLAPVMAEAAGSLQAHLDELDEHLKTAVTAMRGMVRGALKTLHRLESASALPATLPNWGGQQFLSAGPKRSVKLTDAVLDDRIGRVVDALCAAGKEIPKGPDLLWAATHAVVGDGNWTAKVLKPTVDGTIELSTVAQMLKWSGGEKVTANLLLFALAARVRARERGRDHVGFGVLPLDNPLGKASYVPFLELQRKVAAEYGIQLLFLTGVADLRAVGRFPNIIRMANRSSGGRRYVGVIDRDVEPARTGRLSHARIIRPDPIPGL